jgi:Transglycosylase SLT domain
MAEVPSLPSYSKDIVTSEAPTSRLTGAEVAQPYQMLGQAFGKLGEGLEDIAVPLAERGAAEALLKQKVTRNEDGSINVENPVTAPLIFGRAGEAYSHAIAAGTTAQWSNQLSQRFAEIHQKHPVDPSGFMEASNSFLQGIDGNMPPQTRAAIMRQGEQLQTQHYHAITDRAAWIDLNNQKDAIIANIGDLKDTAIGLARKNGVNSPEFLETAKKLNLAFDQLGSNPLFKTSAEQIEREKKNTAELLQGEAIVATIDETFKKKDGKYEAQKIINRDILQNPDLREIDRTRLAAQAMSRLQFLSGDAKETIDANKAIVAEMEKALADRKISAEDPAVGMAIQRAIEIGDHEGAQRLNAAAAVQSHLRALNSLPDAIKSDIVAPRSGASLENIQGAILNQESGNRDNVRVSVTGAIGPGQIEPETFAKYARPGESISNPADNRAVSGRIVADYYQKYGGDAERVAVAYFSGPNNVAPPGSPTPWITDKHDPNGKSVSSYVADVAGRLGGHVVAPSISGGPGFTAEEARRNPFLLSAYVRSLAADPELRIQSARQAATAIGKALDMGILPSPDAVAEVNQAARMFPDKLGVVADEMNGRLVGQKIAALGEEQRTQLIESYKAASSGQDVHQITIANAALEQVSRQQQNMQEHPLTEAANRGWTQPPASIDPAKPETIAPALVQRAVQSKRIGVLNHMPNPPLVDKDDMPKLQTALQSQNGPQVLGSIAQSLKPEEMQTLLREDQFRAAVTGMSRSGDPAKMNAAYSFMDTLQKQNPLQFDRQFPGGLQDLRTWQSNLAYYSPDEAAKRLLRAYDPAESAGREAATAVADKALQLVTPANVVAKFSTGALVFGYGLGPLGTAAQTPVTAEAGAAAGALKADYDMNYRDAFIESGDVATADKLATEKLNLKYGMSPANSNRVTAYPPERYYPQVGGSHDWMVRQLDDQLKVAISVSGNLPREEWLAAYRSSHALVPDETTQREIAAGKPPSYNLVLQQPDGRWTTLPSRVLFYPSAAFAERAAQAEAARPTAQILSEQQQYGTVLP